LLFIGESPPASGRFFYSANSGLYRAMRDAFQAADSRVNESFLAVFRARGCYLVDLAAEPVDRLEPALRRTMRQRGEKALAREIARLQPEMMLRCSTRSSATWSARRRRRIGTVAFFNCRTREDGCGIARHSSRRWRR
jgi:hypothetical protein